MSAPRPLVVAHRAGNDPLALERALALGVDVVELDLHLRRGRVEVRHSKALGPSPLLWERWHLADGLARLPVLDEMLALLARGPATGVMLDMKGADPRLPRAVLRALDAWHGPGPVYVCSRVWWTLAPLASRPGIVPLHSVGTPRQLRALLRRFPPGAGALAGATVKRTLLDPETTGALRRRTDVLMTWSVDTPEEAARLAGWGVTGCISDAPEVLMAAAAAGAG